MTKNGEPPVMTHGLEQHRRLIGLCDQPGQIADLVRIAVSVPALKIPVRHSACPNTSPDRYCVRR